MAYTNSSLVSYTKISPNRTSPRNHAIDTITIHCVVGQCSVETLGNIFAPSSRQASSNYGVGYDGRIGMYVEEKDRSWCSSSAANDNRAVTIEVASDTTHPYAVNAKAYAAMLDLVTDICKRNGIKKLVWSTSKNERVNHLNGCNMTVHRDYANKSCPGDYLYNRHGEIAAEVNKRLGASTGTGSGSGSSTGTATTFKAGDVVKITGSTYYNGKSVPEWVKAKNWIIHSASGDRVVINKSEDGVNAIMSPFKASDLALKNAQQAPTVSSVVTTEPSTGCSGHSVLRKGSTGDEVKELQQKLTTLGYSLGAIDGDFGDKTLAAVKKFQSDYSLEVDGVVGNQTWAALDKAVAAKSSVPYVVRVTTDALNIRKGAGTNYAIVGCIRNRGAYTIVEEKSGAGASKWGLLKAYASGKNGWISLDYVKKV